MYHANFKVTWRSRVLHSTAYTTALLLAFSTWNGQADAAVAPVATSTSVTAAADGTSATILSGSVSAGLVSVPASAPTWFLPSLMSSLSAWLPATISWTPGIPVYLPQVEVDPDPTGSTESYQPAGATYTPANAFFTPFGNGRACVTCHTPNSAMGLSLSSIRSRYVSSYGHDPLFAPVDGATCPKNVPYPWVASPLLSQVYPVAAAEVTSATALSSTDASVALSSGTALSSAATTVSASSASASSATNDTFAPVAATNSLARPIPSYGALAYATILNKGLIRIALPVPPDADFTVQVVSDPYGCNTDPLYNKVFIDGKTLQQLSVYRRPIMSANLKFKVKSVFNNPGVIAPGLPGSKFPVPPFAKLFPDSQGNLENGNIMWDGREATLSSQAIDALRNHAQIHFQLASPPFTDWINQMISFESGIYTAQITDNAAGSLTSQAATGGPVALSNNPTGTSPLAPAPEVMSLYDAWNPAKTAEGPAQASIYRGQTIFNGGSINGVAKTFTITNVAGVNNFLGPVVKGESCSSCHGQFNVGAGSFANSQIDIGIAGNLGTTGKIFRSYCGAC